MPPSTPAVAGASCYLTSDWRGAQEAGDRNTNYNTWTHVMLVDLGVDIRDSYIGNDSHSTQDAVYIPDGNGTRFIVTFVERVQRGSPFEHKRVYLDRQTPPWPTNEL